MSAEIEDSYSGDSFFEDEPTSSKRDEENTSLDLGSACIAQQRGESKSLTFDIDERIRIEPTEESTENNNCASDVVVKSFMSTIEEESRSYETSTSLSHSRQVMRDEGTFKSSRTEDLNLGETLKELQQFVNDTESRYEQESHEKTLLSKLDTLESAQNILEQVFNFNTEISNDIDINAIISYIPVVDSTALNVENGDDVSQRSFNSEIASIQRIIDGGCDISCSTNPEEVTEGSKLLSASATSPQVNAVSTSSKGERAVDDVLREYEEFERSLSRVSAMDESFGSDVSTLPPLSAFSSKPEEAINFVPAIKPPVLKCAPLPTTYNNQPTMVPPPDSAPLTKNSSTKPVKSVVTNGLVNRKVGESKSTSVPNTTRVEVSHSTLLGVKSNAHAHHSARPTASATITTGSSKELTQEAFKPRNRKSMRSPRTMISPRQAPVEPFTDLPANSSRVRASGDGYHKTIAVANCQEKSEYAVTEALKTIEKLNAMVTRQETLLEAYSSDNQKLWINLKEAKTESQKKEGKFQDVINQLQSELATLKLNRLVASSTANSPRQTSGNRAELHSLREDSELKNQQLIDLRKEILILQSKLTEVRSPAKTKQATGTVVLSQDKEREYQKNINTLNKQVRTLQNILYSKEQTAPPTQQQNNTSQTICNKSRPLQRTKSDVGKQNAKMHQQAMVKSVRMAGVDATGIFNRKARPSGGINIKSSDILQASLSCLGQEREDFEEIIAEKNKLIFEKERMILQLKDKLETLKRQLPEAEAEVVDHCFIDELRSRVITQNQVIQTLKEHLSSYKKMEAENSLLREEKSILEKQILDMKRKFEFTQDLGKPENEVLSILSEKVEELSSRYYHREQQLDTLLNRLALKTTTGGNNRTTNPSPLRSSLDQFNNNNASLGGALLRDRTSAMYSADLLHMAEFSPTTSFQLLNAVSDLPEM